MNKKLIALAIATAFAAPVAMADSGNVKISGQIHMSFDSINGYAGGTANGTSANQNQNQTMSNVSSNASQITFSGDEDMGNGLKAIWQVQSYITMGGSGNSSDTTTTSGDVLGNGVSFLGLTGGFGTVQLGKLESPFKVVGGKVDLFRNQIGDSRNIISVGGGMSAASSAFGTAPYAPVNSIGAGNTWDLRPSSTVAYATPVMNGAQVVAAYVTNQGTPDTSTSSGAANSANTTASTSAISVSGTYENGPVFAGLAYERHNVPGAAKTVAPSAWRLSAGYNFGDLKLVGLYQRTMDNNATEGVATINTIGSENTTAASDDDRNTWGVGAAYKMGSNTLKAQYYIAGDFGGFSNSGANMWALGLDHAMSKRTTAYVAYARTANDTRTVNGAAANLSVFSATAGGHGDNAGSNPGQNTNAVSVGMIHNF